MRITTYPAHCTMRTATPVHQAHNQVPPCWTAMLRAVFGTTWIGQQRFTTTTQIDALHDALQLWPGAYALEIQSGTGTPAMRLAHRTSSSVVGIDADPASVWQACQHPPSVSEHTHFFAGTFADAPFTPASFDGIVATDALFGVADKLHLLSKVARLLLPGGRVACTLVVASGDADEMRLTAALPPLPSATAYRALIHQAGLSLIDCTDLTPTFQEVCTRWWGALAVWEQDLCAAVGVPHYQALVATIGKLAYAGMQGQLSHIQLVAARPEHAVYTVVGR